MAPLYGRQMQNQKEEFKNRKNASLTSSALVLKYYPIFKVVRGISDTRDTCHTHFGPQRIASQKKKCHNKKDIMPKEAWPQKLLHYK